VLFCFLILKLPQTAHLCVKPFDEIMRGVKMEDKMSKSKEQVMDLKPTQFAVGMMEVSTKISKLKDQKDPDSFLKDHPVPVVKSSFGVFIVDHHHLVRACWEIGIKKVYVEIIADLGELNPQDFWKEMQKKNWTYLHDQFGNGPHPPEKLPQDIRGMADDPYRSLSWAVREEGGYEKDHTPFSEFHWAEFFRKKINDVSDFHHAVKEALRLCSLPEAKKLPGAITQKS